MPRSILFLACLLLNSLGCAIQPTIAQTPSDPPEPSPYVSGAGLMFAVWQVATLIQPQVCQSLQETAADRPLRDQVQEACQTPPSH